MENFQGPAPRETQDRRTLLDRILDTPNLQHVVPRLQPELLHRVIQSCGLEDCGELVVLATPEQLTRIFDLDLWRSAQPGMDEQFDADRFGVWLEVLADFGAGMAAQKLTEMDADLVIVGLAQHARVFDCAVVTPYRTTDGVESTGIREPDHGIASEVGGYRLFAKRTDSWEAIVAILISLDAEHPDYFHQVMRGCRALSNSGRELDELDNLLAEKDQIMFDLALDRERRRDEKGYVPPAQARAFLEMSRRLWLESDTMPPANPVALAYLRSLTTAAHSPPRVLSPSKGPTPEDPLQAAAALADLLLEAGIIAQQPRALLNGSQDQTADHTGALRRIRTHMQVVSDRDHAAYARRSEELTYVANTIMAGCALQGRPFTAQEASDAAVAVCNLGLENWPPLWIAPRSARPTGRSLKTRSTSPIGRSLKKKPLPDDFLVNHDLLTVFQVGWMVLHKDVCLYAAERLLEVLAGLRCDDRNVQTGLDALRIELSKCCRVGMPWCARESLDVIAILDMPAWMALLGLIDECPVLHAALDASRNPRTRSVSASAFEFISENSQIASIREFMESLPETLRP
jgi:Family of unknown function (DUF6178)